MFQNRVLCETRHGSPEVWMGSLCNTIPVLGFLELMKSHRISMDRDDWQQPCPAWRKIQCFPLVYSLQRCFTATYADSEALSVHVTHSVTCAWREGVINMDRAKHMDENVAALNFEATSNHVEEEVSSRRTNLNLKPPSFFKGLRCLVEMSLPFLPFFFFFCFKKVIKRLIDPS